MLEQEGRAILTEHRESGETDERQSGFMLFYYRNRLVIADGRSNASASKSHTSIFEYFQTEHSVVG